MTKTHLLALGLALAMSSEAIAKDWVYVVSKGDSLWHIAKAHLTDVSYYQDIKRLNNITKPKSLPPGTSLRIPLEWVKRFSANVVVKHITGHHKVIRNKQTLKLTQGDKLQLGDELVTSGKGTVTIEFADGSEMTLSEQVIIRFDHLTQYGQTGMVDTRVRLDQGKIEIRAEKQTGIASRLDIATASAVTSVRGTVFRVGVAEQNEEISTVEVVEGEVAVQKGQQSVSVNQGFALSVDAHNELAQPIKLLAPPALSRKRFEMGKSPSKIHWPAVPNASQYRVQISQNPEFSALLLQQKSTKPNVTIQDLTQGKYYFRVTAFDHQGIEGLPAHAEIRVNDQNQLTAPELKGVSTTQQNYIYWPSLANGQHIEFQLSLNKDFSKAKIIAATGQNQYPIDRVNRPVWYFRARTKTLNPQQTSQWSKPCKVSTSNTMIVCGI